MTTSAISNTYTVTTPGVYTPSTSTSTPVVATGQSTTSINAAVNLSNTASVVLNLFGGSSGAGTYSATGILQNIASAGSATAKPTTPAEQQQSLGQGILASLTSPTSTDGIYSGSGIFSSTSGISNDFATILHDNPSLSSLAVSDSFAQGVVGTLISTYA